jgi:hypothetical protein
MREERRQVPRNQSFFDLARIPNPRVLDPTLTASLWTLFFTIPTLMAAATVNLAYESKYDFLVNFAAIYMVAIYVASVLTGIVFGVPLYRLLERANMQFGFLYLIAGFSVYGTLFVFMSIEMHMGLYHYVTAEYGDIFQNYLRGIQAFKYLWPGFAFLGMAMALTGWARLLKE